MKRFVCTLAAALSLGAAATFTVAPVLAQDGGAAEAQAKKKTAKAWVADLGSDDFQVREHATEALSKMGKEALPALQEAAKSPDPEVRWRAEKALKLVKARVSSRRVEKPQGEQTPRIAKPGQRPGAPAPGLEGIEEELKRELDQIDPQLKQLFKGLFRDGPMRELFPREFEDAFKQMEESLRDLDKPRDEQRRDPFQFRSFRTFRFKDGKWEMSEPGGRPSEARALGVRTQPVAPLLRAQLQLGDRPAIAVERVDKGTLGDTAGVRTHDLITSIDGQPVTSAADLDPLTVPGEHRIEVIRRGQPLKLTLTTPEREAPPKRAPAPRKQEEKQEEKQDERKF